MIINGKPSKTQIIDSIASYKLNVFKITTFQLFQNSPWKVCFCFYCLYCCDKIIKRFLQYLCLKNKKINIFSHLSYGALLGPIAFSILALFFLSLNFRIVLFKRPILLPRGFFYLLWLWHGLFLFHNCRYGIKH